MNSFTYYNDILGRIRIKEDGGSIVAIEFANGDEHVEAPVDAESTDIKLLDQAYMEIDEYLRGHRKNFTFPYRMEGTPFQIKVWSALLDIPYGETRTYKEIAEAIDNPKGMRAVGNANNKNKLPILIPCHRVIGARGDLVGYAGGVDVKARLLEIERKVVFAEG